MTAKIIIQLLLLPLVVVVVPLTLCLAWIAEAVSDMTTT